ncbi:AraC family ligand binding domain-containing protein, partial [Nonomuraea rhizosphaerae]|uniref:AraC family ligand binding domain-containing protein n=1 Tax=Nonomuraea rhizosphaerae TaxID=2665663 RepID=UPI001C5FB7BA
MTAEDMSVPAAELTIVGHYDNRPGYATRRPSGSPSWLLMWTQAGAGLVEQAGVSFTAGPGDLVVLGADAPQHYRVAPGAGRWRFWWAHFQPRPDWLTWLGEHARAPGCHLMAGVPEPARERIEAAFERASRNAHWPPHAAPGPALAGPAPAPAASDPAQPAPGPPRIGRAPVVAVSGPARELVLDAVEEVVVLGTA